MTLLLDGFVDASMKAAFSAFQMITGYSGSLFTIQRSDDGATQTFGPIGIGTDFWKPDVAAIRAWLGSSQNVITVIFDQLTGLPLCTVDTNQSPSLNFDGPVPTIGFRGDNFTLGGVLGPLAGTYNNVNMASMFIQRLSGDPGRYQGPSQLMSMSINANGDIRFSILFTPGVHAGPPGGSSTEGTRLDAVPAVTAVGLDALDQTYRLQVGLMDLTAPSLTTWLDARKQSETALTTGNTSASNSRRQFIGNFQGTWTCCGLMTRQVSDGDVATWSARVPDMTVYDAVNTWSINPLRRSFWSYPYVSYRNGIYTTTYNDRQSKQYVSQIPGIKTLVSDRAVNASDHAAPVHDWEPNNGRLLIPYSGHGDEESIHYRLSTDGTVANLGVETELSTDIAAYNSGTTYAAGVFVSSGGSLYISLQAGNLNHAPISSPTFWRLLGTDGDQEYVRLRFYGATNTAWITTQKGNRTWGGFLCTNTASVGAWTFGGFQPLICCSTNTMYFIDDWVNSTTLGMIAAETPAHEGNSLRLVYLDFSTGIVSANGVSYGKWDGTPVSGKYLPVDIADAGVPVIYTVPSGKAIRWFDVGHSCTAVLLAKYDSPVLDSTSAGLYIIIAGADRFQPWTEHFICDLGETFDSDNERWSGAVFSNVPHVGYMIYLGRRDGATANYFAETWTSPDGITWTNAETLATRDTVVQSPVSPKYTDGTYAATILNFYEYDLNSGGSRELIFGGTVVPQPGTDTQVYRLRELYRPLARMRARKPYILDRM